MRLGKLGLQQCGCDAILYIVYYHNIDGSRQVNVNSHGLECSGPLLPPIMMDAKKEDALRLHIREKLLDYALTHLTVDHVSFTENAVVEAGLSLFILVWKLT